MQNRKPKPTLGDVLIQLDANLPKEEVSKRLNSFSNSDLTSKKVCDQEGKTPLMCAIISGNVHAVEWLFTKHGIWSPGDPGWAIEHNRMTAFAHATNFSENPKTAVAEEKDSANKKNLVKKRKAILNYLLEILTLKSINKYDDYHRKNIDSVTTEEINNKLKIFEAAFNSIAKNNNVFVAEVIWNFFYEQITRIHSDDRDKISFSYVILLKLAVKANAADLIKWILDHCFSWLAQNEKRLEDTEFLRLALPHENWEVVELLLKSGFVAPDNVFSMLFKIVEQKPQNFDAVNNILYLINKPNPSESHIFDALSLPEHGVELGNILFRKRIAVTAVENKTREELLTKLLEKQQTSKPDEFRIYKAMYIEVTQKLSITPLHVKTALSLPHNGIDTAATLLANCAATTENFMTLFLQTQKESKQNDNEFSSFQWLYRETRQKQRITAEHIKLALTLPTNRMETVSTLLFPPSWRSMTYVNEGDLSFALAPLLEAKEEFVDEKSPILNCIKDLVKNCIITKEHLTLALKLPRLQIEVFKILLTQLKCSAIVELVDIWKTTGKPLSELIDLVSWNEIALQQFMSTAVQKFAANESPDEMLTAVKKLPIKNWLLKLDDVKRAAESKDKTLLKLLLTESKVGHSWNSINLSKELSLQVWQHPRAAVRFIDDKSENREVKSAYSPVAALLQNYKIARVEKTIEMEWKDVAYGLDELFKRNLKTLTLDDALVAVETGDERLLLKLIKEANCSITTFFEAAVKNGNLAIIKLVMNSHEEMEGAFLEIALRYKNFELLHELLSRPIRYNRFELNIVQLLEFYRLGKVDPQIKLTEEILFEIIALLQQKKPILFDIEAFKKAIDIGEAVLINRIIEIIKEQKSPLDTLLQFVVSINNLNYTQKLLTEGANTSTQTWEQAVLLEDPRIFKLLLGTAKQNKLDLPTDLLKFASKNQKLEVVKELLVHFPWKPHKLAEARTGILESKEMLPRRISGILFFVGENLKFISHNQDYFNSLEEEDKNFISAIINERERVKGLSTAPQASSTQPQEPKPEEKVELLTAPSAPPADHSVKDAKDHPAEAPKSPAAANKDPAGEETAPEETVAPPTPVIISQPPVKQVSEEIIPTIAPAPVVILNPPVKQPVEATTIDTVRPEGSPALPAPIKDEKDAPVPLQIEGVPSITGFFKESKLEKRRKKDFIPNFLNSITTAQELWKNNPRLAGLLASLQVGLEEEFERLNPEKRAANTSLHPTR